MTEAAISGPELEKALLKGELTQEKSHLVGLVKQSEKEGHICFSTSGCNSWIDVPTEMIKQAVRLCSMTCRATAYPLMQITLMEPKEAESKVLFTLLTDLAATHTASRIQYSTRCANRQSDAMSAPVPCTQLMMRRAPPKIQRPSPIFGGGWNIFPEYPNPCCCSYSAVKCDENGYCWPVFYNVCISCPAGDWCGCSETGPFCHEGPIV